MMVVLQEGFARVSLRGVDNVLRQGFDWNGLLVGEGESSMCAESGGFGGWD